MKIEGIKHISLNGVEHEFQIELVKNLANYQVVNDFPLLNKSIKSWKFIKEIKNE